MKKKSGVIIVIVAPSGTGKSTLITRLKKEFPELVESVSFTTRPQRPGEDHGKHYHFINVVEFKKMIEENDFLEWALVHSNYYGTSKRFVQETLDSGKNILFDLDTQGTDALKKHFGEVASSIFIAPPSIEELENRLNARGTESEEVIKKRIENARREILRQDDYDYKVPNHDLEEAYKQLSKLFKKILGKK